MMMGQSSPYNALMETRWEYKGDRQSVWKNSNEHNCDEVMKKKRMDSPAHRWPAVPSGYSIGKPLDFFPFMLIGISQFSIPSIRASNHLLLLLILTGLFDRHSFSLITGPAPLNP